MFKPYCIFYNLGSGFYATIVADITKRETIVKRRCKLRVFLLLFKCAFFLNHNLSMHLMYGLLRKKVVTKHECK